MSVQGNKCCGFSLFLSFFSFKDRQYNMRKLTELPTALIGAERWQLFIESICCIPFVEVSTSSTTYAFNMVFLIRILIVIPEQEKEFKTRTNHRNSCKMQVRKYSEHISNNGFYYCHSFLTGSCRLR